MSSRLSTHFCVNTGEYPPRNLVSEQSTPDQLIKCCDLDNHNRWGTRIYSLYLHKLEGHFPVHNERIPLFAAIVQRAEGWLAHANRVVKHHTNRNIQSAVPDRKLLLHDQMRNLVSDEGTVEAPDSRDSEIAKLTSGYEFMSALIPRPVVTKFQEDVDFFMQQRIPRWSEHSWWTQVPEGILFFTASDDNKKAILPALSTHSPIIQAVVPTSSAPASDVKICELCCTMRANKACKNNCCASCCRALQTAQEEEQIPVSKCNQHKIDTKKHPSEHPPAVQTKTTSPAKRKADSLSTKVSQIKKRLSKEPRQSSPNV